MVQMGLNRKDIQLVEYVYRFLVGKSSTPFYYILVSLQLALLTPWIVKIIYQNKILSKILWLITPMYLVLLYSWNFMYRVELPLYETYFPAWFGFYYLGIKVKNGMKLKKSISGLLVAFIFSCVESILLRRFGMSQNFYISQITIGSFLYSASMLGVIIEQESKCKIYVGKQYMRKFLSKIGDCSYGIFFIHIFVMMIVGKVTSELEITNNFIFNYGLRYILTCLISYGTVRIGQMLFKKNKKLLLWSGLV